MGTTITKLKRGSPLVEMGRGEDETEYKESQLTANIYFLN